jgi:hypothetical protein
MRFFGQVPLKKPDVVHGEMYQNVYILQRCDFDLDGPLQRVIFSATSLRRPVPARDMTEYRESSE